MSKKSAFFLFLFCLTGFLSTRAQTIENVVSSYDGEKMVIIYDLNATGANQKFKVSLFSSHNNYGQPLTLLTGDFGDNILPGKNHLVTWDVKNSVPADFDGDISIKVKASLIVPVVVAPIKTDAASKLAIKPLTLDTYKKGSTIEVGWTGGQASDKLIIELLKGGVVQQKMAEKANSTQHYSWQMPKDVKAGKDYVVRVTNSSRSEDQAGSQVFSIKPKVPLLLKIAPVIAVGGAIAFLGGSKSSSEPAQSDLPGPVRPN